MAGMKYDSGKMSFRLINSAALRFLAEVLEHGAKKYDSWNWAEGIDYSRLVDAAKRHLDKWFFFCEEIDEDSGLHHLGGVMFSVYCLCWYEMNRETYGKFDDRPSLSFDRAPDSYYMMKVDASEYDSGSTLPCIHCGSTSPCSIGLEEGCVTLNDYRRSKDAKGEE